MIEFDEILGLNDDRVPIEIELSGICNLRCSYCNPVNHNGERPWADSSMLLETLHKIYEECKKPFVLTLVGGEPSLWPEASYVLPLIKNIDKDSHIRIVSNGIRSYKWFNAHKDYLDGLLFSYHPEGKSIEKWIKNINNVNIPYVISVLGNAETWDKVIYNYNYVKEHSTASGVQLKAVTPRGGWVNFVNYTEQQKEIIRNSLCLLKDDINTWPKYWGELKYKNKYINNFSNGHPGLNFSDLLFLGKNKFKGWKCNAGINRFTFKSNGKIHGSSGCSIRNDIGNWHKGEIYNFYNEPAICKYDSCNCATDVGISKRKI